MRPTWIAAACVALTVSCGGGGIGVASPPQPLPESTVERRSETISEDHVRFWPSSAAVEEGVGYRFTAYTHCGLDHLFDLDASFWEVTDGPEEPWEVLDDPDDEGVVTVVSRDTAVYESSGGGRFQLRRLEGPRDVLLCE